ncbi:hypothetical protein ACLIMP_19875 [Novosphingobium aerophilum]|uniref:hypothetical protein n=1 Tax=Novosphingobium aerophilum TaxID=2839843 RepID=UPI003FD4B2D2
MFLAPTDPARRAPASDMAALLDQVAHASSRPRYAFMVLSLIAEIARPDGSAGPFIAHRGQSILLRDWLCDALTPMGGRDPKRQALMMKVRAELERTGRLPQQPTAAEAAIEAEVRERVRSSGKTNLSRATTELVKAGLIQRHYQGFRVDHHNRGAQRHVVYTLTGRARCLMGRSGPTSGDRRQGELALN